MLAGRRIKDPNESKAVPKRRTVVNIFFDGSTERMREIAFGNQSVNFDKEAENPDAKRSKDIDRWHLTFIAAAEWDEENIAGFVVHLDETICTTIASSSLSSKASSLLENVAVRMVAFRIATAQLEEVLSSLREAFPYSDSLPTERLQTFVDRGREIAKCAGMLFFGYVNDATNFAQTHGGEGGSDDRDRSRKNDDDDRR